MLLWSEFQSPQGTASLDEHSLDEYILTDHLGSGKNSAASHISRIHVGG